MAGRILLRNDPKTVSNYWEGPEPAHGPAEINTPIGVLASLITYEHDQIGSSDSL